MSFEGHVRLIGLSMELFSGVISYDLALQGPNYVRKSSQYLKSAEYTQPLSVTGESIC